MSLKNFGFLIDGVQTDIVIGDFSDNLFILVTQYKKVGCIISVEKEAFYSLENQEDIYEIKTLFGADDGSAHLAARYLAEQIGIPKSAVFAINLRDSSVGTLRAVKDALIGVKTW